MHLQVPSFTFLHIFAKRKKKKRKKKTETISSICQIFFFVHLLFISSFRLIFASIFSFSFCSVLMRMPPSLPPPSCAIAAPLRARAIIWCFQSEFVHKRKLCMPEKKGRGEKPRRVLSSVDST